MNGFHFMPHLRFLISSKGHQCRRNINGTCWLKDFPHLIWVFIDERGRYNHWHSYHLFICAVKLLNHSPMRPRHVAMVREENYDSVLCEPAVVKSLQYLAELKFCQILAIIIELVKTQGPGCGIISLKLKGVRCRNSRHVVLLLCRNRKPKLKRVVILTPWLIAKRLVKGRWQGAVVLREAIWIQVHHKILVFPNVFYAVVLIHRRRTGEAFCAFAGDSRRRRIIGPRNNPMEVRFALDFRELPVNGPTAVVMRIYQ